MYKISEEHLEACARVLLGAAEVARFTKNEFALIDKMLVWLDQPDEDFIFSLSIGLSNKGESIYVDFGHDGSCFNISETQHAYEPGVGGDTFTAYEYRQCEDDCEESGEIYEWEKKALELLGYFDDEEERMKVEVSISVE